MRVSLLPLVVVLALALAPALALGQEGRVVEHGSWSQYEPAWREGPVTIEFQHRSVEVPFGARYATDGETFLYSADAPPPTRPGIPEHCTEFPAEGTWVLLKEETCRFARHPSVSCDGTHVCTDAQGQPRTAPPTTPPTPLSQLTDKCGKLPGAKCTPAGAAPLVAGVGVALLALGRRGG